MPGVHGKRLSTLPAPVTARAMTGHFVSSAVLLALAETPSLRAAFEQQTFGRRNILGALQQSNVGIAFDAGVAIVLLAMVLDRLTAAASKETDRRERGHWPPARIPHRRFIGLILGGAAVLLVLGQLLPTRGRVSVDGHDVTGLPPTADEVRAFLDRHETVFVVEQNANMALSIADRGYVIQTGEVVLADTAQNLLSNPLMREAYLGEL